MNCFRRLLVLFAGLFGTAGVAAAAAGAHAFSDPALTTAAYFLMIGACAMAATAALGAARGPSWSFSDVSGGLIALGTLLFSGALAGRVVWNVVLFPMAAPIGGTMLMAGWLVLTLTAFGRRTG